MIRPNLWPRLICALALLSAPVDAFAGQVPDPTNAPSSTTAGDILSATANPQQAADSGVSLSGVGQNYALLGPASGGAGAASWRKLTSADLPSGIGAPGGSSGQLQYNNAGVFGGVALGGDCTFSEPNITCTKSNGVAFGTAAFQPTSAFDASGAATAAQSAAESYAANASNISSGTVPSARLPLPTTTAPGAVEAIVAVSHQFLTSITTAGVPALTQPAFSDLSGSIAAGQLILPTSTTLGAIEAVSCPSHQWINAVPTTAVQPTCAQPAFGDISGTIAASQLGGLSKAASALTRNVTMTPSTTYVDGPSVNVGTSGTWWVIANVTFTDTSSSRVRCKLWDGTTPIAYGGNSVSTTSQYFSVSLGGYITNPAGNIRASCENITDATGTMVASADAGATDTASTIFAIRIN